MISWNVRGLNNKIHRREVRSHLKKLDGACIALLETRVKQAKAEKIQKDLGNWEVTDNYTHHANGRIWILWDLRRVSF